MNAKDIKRILIAYLKATSREVRIYQEKSIGNAVCDLMAVTDHLTGYEIKSDLDNYRRLDGQIAAAMKMRQKELGGEKNPYMEQLAALRQEIEALRVQSL